MAHTPAFSRLRRLLATATYARRHDVPVADAEQAFARFLVDRRAVLKGLAATASLAAAPAMSGCPAPNQGRVAVVGAGIAGLHCAWRLAEAGIDVTVYEAQDRVGGRMWTGRGLFPDGLIFEIGGELIDSNHATMWALAEEFGIQLDDRWAEEPPGLTRETFYVSGDRVTAATLLQQSLPVSAIMEQQITEAEEDDDAYAALDATSLQAWLDQYVPIATAPELHQVLRVAFVGEYGLEADSQSALNLLYLFGWDTDDEFLIFGESDERWHTHLGNDTFTTALADAIGTQGIVTGRRLVAASGSGPYTLSFEATADSAPSEVEVDHVVFALPFTVLRLVDLSGLTLSDDKREVIAELGYGTNAKVMGGFSRRPWWEDHAESGLLTTDLPVQQGWDSTIGQEPGTGSGIWTNFMGGDQGTASGLGTPEQWFDAVVDDLEVLWPGSRAAWTGDVQRMHWPTFGWARGSYTCYQPGQWRFWSLEGVREGNVHFCGEHCSLDFQGWMEGGAETGGLVAAEIFDDLGVPRTAALEIAVGARLRTDQPCYHGDQRPRQRFARRTRRVRAR